jgi:serine/threonine protein kinase
MTDPSKAGQLGHPELLGETHPLVRSEVAPAADEDLPAGTRLGDWRVEDKIGQGGMGTVYAAVHAEIGKRAAIKVVRSELCRSPLTAERFVQEARVVNQIGHPNIVDIFHIGRLRDGRPYLVMELLRGCTLADRLGAGRMLATDAIDVLLEVCAAMAAAHAHSVVHRDLKPENIFLIEGPGGRGAVKIVDWGIAKLTDALPVTIGLTTTGVMMGTPQYVSPEQARGKSLDARTDIYSLGAIAYEMFLEGPPFIADNVADIISMHLREAPPPPSDVWPDIPPSLEALLLKMLAKEAEERPTVAEVVSALQLVRRDLDVRAQTQSGRRLAQGSLPPVNAAMANGSGPAEIIGADRPNTGRDVTVPIGARAARAARTDEVRMSPPARWPWALGALAVVSATIAAIVIFHERTPAKPTIAKPATPVERPAVAVPVPIPVPVEVGAEAPAPVPVPTSASLTLRVLPTSAQVIVDGIPVPTPHGRAVRDLATGPHEVRIEARGYTTYTRSIDVTEDLVIDVDLQPARRHPAPRPRPASGAPTPSQTPVDPNATIEPFR